MLSVVAEVADATPVRGLKATGAKALVVVIRQRTANKV